MPESSIISNLCKKSERMSTTADHNHWRGAGVFSLQSKERGFKKREESLHCSSDTAVRREKAKVDADMPDCAPGAHPVV